jgi:hypothetical protein
VPHQATRRAALLPAVRLIALMLAVGIVVVLHGTAPAKADRYPIAVIRVLDKVTARVRTMDAPVDKPVQFGSLTIVAHACDKRPPEETPETAAFLEITETKSGGAAQTVFSGWMFASSPSLSAMEDPIYDVWVIDCSNTTDSASPATSGGKEE